MSPEPLEILMVEDNEDDVLLIQESFQQARLANIMNVVWDGEEALEFLRGEGRYAGSPCRPGLVLLDINMPRKNGFEVLREMKVDPNLCEIPVVILTTSHREEDVARSYAGGACSFVTKPVGFTQMLQVAKDFSLYWVLIARVPPWKPSQRMSSTSRTMTTMPS